MNSTPVAKQKILIDTDPGQDIDDLLAIWFAMLRPELDVVGITTVTWPTDGRARLVKRLLRYLNRTNVLVAAGMAYPLRPFSADEEAAQHNLDRVMNHRSFAEPHDPADAPDDLDAVDFIIRTVEQYPGQIILACIAPLTNIATALRRKPEIAKKIKHIALMGGETALNRREHNIAFDYVASSIVFTSGIPIVMGTWSVTRQFTMTLTECDTAFRHHRGELPIAMAEAIKQWHPAQSWKPGPVMYDLFPIVWAFDKTYYNTLPMSVRVETTGEFTKGMTVPWGDSKNIEVTTDVRAEELKQFYLSTILG